MEEHMRLRKSILILGVAILLFGATMGVSGQATGDATATVTINDVALLNVNATSVPTFIVDDPAAAGAMPKITPAGGPTYLQYTVVISGTAKKITASSDLAMPKGLKLDIWAATPTGTGGLGTPVAGGLMVNSAYVANAASSLITGITSCATGSGLTQGPAIYYTLSIDAATFNQMVTQAAVTYTITYTLLDV